jgi:lipopolysaccharide export system protein LptA
VKTCGWLLLFLLLTTPLAAEDGALAAPDGPIEVSSQRMEADQQSGNVIFSGQVVAKRGEMTIYAEQLKLYFVESDEKREIERLEADGSVRVVDGERVATAQKLEYVQTEEKMTLTGEAEIHQGGNLIAGDEIVLFIRENRSLVKSDKDGRVRAVFLPAREKP